MAWGFFFDNTRCTGCKTCQMACKDYHDLDASITYRRVIDYEGGSWQHNAQGEATMQQVYAYHVSLACNHCNEPACAQVCPTGAMHQDERGLVWPDHRKCIGCGYCTMACPYHAPVIDQHAKKSVKCDGCRTRLEADLPPICVAACPLRALECGEVSDLDTRFPHTVRCILPLPAEDATHPNILIKPSPAATLANEQGGGIANQEEIR